MTELIVHNPFLARSLAKQVLAITDAVVYAVSGNAQVSQADNNAIDAAIPTTATVIRIIESERANALWFENISGNFK